MTDKEQQYSNQQPEPGVVAAEKEKAPAGELSLTEVIREQATEEESPESNYFTLRQILGGDLLSTAAVRRQIWVFVLITVFVIVYISNRYSCQQSLIKIDKLNAELKDAKYRALSSSSQLTELSRESHVLEQLRLNNDTLLHVSPNPPYIINVTDNE